MHAREISANLNPEYDVHVNSQLFTRGFRGRCCWHRHLVNVHPVVIGPLVRTTIFIGVTRARLIALALGHLGCGGRLCVPASAIPAAAGPSKGIALGLTVALAPGSHNHVMGRLGGTGITTEISLCQGQLKSVQET